MMKNLPDKKQLDIMWTVATSGALETGTRPHYGFADLLYDYLTDNLKNTYGVEFCYESEIKGKTSDISYKEAEIIRDTWPSLYTYQRILEDEKKKNDLEDLGFGLRREGGER